MPNFRFLYIRFIILLIYILNLISIILCQFDDESMSKAIACMSVISQQFNGEEPEPSIYSTMMLKCFMTLSSSQSKSILLGLETGRNVLSKKEIYKLTDYESLKDMPHNELKKKSYELEKALKNIKKMQEDITGERGGDIDPSEYDYDDDYDDDNFNQETPSNINFFSLIPKGIYGIFNVFNSYLSLFFVFAIVYFGLLMIRKINDSEKKMKKKKRIMEKKMEEEYEEEEDEDEQEINNDSKRQIKNKKNGK